MPELIIGDHNFQQHSVPPAGQSMGLVPRNFAAVPAGSHPYTPVWAQPVFPRAEQIERIADQLANKRRNSDFRRKGNNGQPIPAMDQNGKGYCWSHGPVQAVQIQRAVRGLPFADLSAYSVACIIKNFRDEGGWCGEALKFLVERGVATAKTWPQRSMNRANDNPATWAEAALYKVTEGFYDLASPIWGQKLSFDQLVTALLLNLVAAIDLNWWGHDVSALDAIYGGTQWGITRADSGKLLTRAEFDIVWGMNDPVTGGISIRILNSWSNTYGDMGEAILTGSKCIPDGAIAIAVAGA